MQRARRLITVDKVPGLPSAVQAWLKTHGQDYAGEVVWFVFIAGEMVSRHGDEASALAWLHAHAASQDEGFLVHFNDSSRDVCGDADVG